MQSKTLIAILPPLLPLFLEKTVAVNELPRFPSIGDQTIGLISSFRFYLPKNEDILTNFFIYIDYEFYFVFFYYCSQIKKIKIMEIKKNKDKIVLYNGVEDKVIVYVCS